MLVVCAVEDHIVSRVCHYSRDCSCQTEYLVKQMEYVRMYASLQ